MPGHALPQPPPPVCAGIVEADEDLVLAGCAASAAEGHALVAKGLSFAEVGKTLVISPHTVTAHVRKIYRKLAVNSRSEAVFEARQMGLLK